MSTANSTTINYDDLDSMDQAASTCAGDQPADLRRHMAIIGGSGVGKTTWTCQAEDVLVLLTEPQARGRIRETNPKAHIMPVENLEQLAKVNEWLATRVFAPGYKGFVPRFIGVDSFTEISRMLQEAIGRGKEGEWTHQMWGKYKQKLTNIVRKFRDLPVTLLGVFYDEVNRGEEGEVGARRMAVGMKSMSPIIAGLFDMVFWAEVVEKALDDGTDKIKTQYLLRTVGGNWRGNMLEQGKGHEALEKWLDASKMKPHDVIAKVNAWKRPTETATPSEPAPESKTQETGSKADKATKKK